MAAGPPVRFRWAPCRAGRTLAASLAVVAILAGGVAPTVEARNASWSLTRTPGSVPLATAATIAFTAANASVLGAGNEIGCIVIAIPTIRFAVNSATVDLPPPGTAWAATTGPGGPGTALVRLRAQDAASRLVGGSNAAALRFTIGVTGLLPGNANWTADVYNQTDCTVNLGLSQQFSVTVSFGIPPANSAPVAAADSASVVAGGQLSVPAPGVLGNDTDADGDPLSANLVSGVTHGSLVLYADGGYDYLPLAGYVGVDSFRYAANDGAASSPGATVTINVTNALPSGVADSYAVQKNVARVVAPAAGVLANDTDADTPTQTLTATINAQPSNGTVSLASDGGLTYTPANGYAGADAFTYDLTDGFAVVGP
ncbi:MAG: large repetitive protein, partial [Chloroflexota bacterium]|nr:large repetitive protein [Chloroflexota bacterium]